MNIIFLRHGEATDNVKELISDKEIYWSILTQKGIDTVKESIKSLPTSIDKIYVSPLPRTIETAHYVRELYPKTEVVIDERIRELYHGKYTHEKNNEILDNTRIKQINGDYFIRLGEYGENNYDIESRLCQFLKNIYQTNLKDNTIMIVSHGSITSYMKRILKIKTAHIQTGKMEIFECVDFEPLFKHIKKLEKIKKDKINYRINEMKKLETNLVLKKRLIKLAKKEFNNIEFDDDIVERYVEGYNTNKLNQITNPTFEGNIILVCFYCDFENFADYWINHYLNIGIKNFVLVDNNTKDETTSILRNYSNKANISFWKLNEKYNCYNMCGWKQRIFEYYGVGNIYITVDSDELLIYKNYKNNKIDEFIKNHKNKNIKAMMLDVYSNKELYKGTIEDYRYVDKGTYKSTSSAIFGQRLYGGPRFRVFGISPSIQKIPIINYTGKEVYANDHFYYPFEINNNAEFCAYLLHYKFLPGDEEKYNIYAKDRRHWNNSREYIVYNNFINKRITLYDKNVSILIDDIDYNF